MTRLLAPSIAAAVLLMLVSPANSFSSPFQKAIESKNLHPRFRAKPTPADDMPRIETSSWRFKWYEKAKSSEIQSSRDSQKSCVRARISHWRKRTQKAAGSFLAVSLLAFSLRNPAFAGTSGGRCGGSFGPSGRSSAGSSSMRSSPMRSYCSSSSRRYYRPPLYSRGYSSTRLYSGRPIAATKTSPAEMVVVTGAGALIVYGLVNNKRDPLAPQNSAALGPGVSVASITVALNVPNRDDKQNVLYRVRRLSESAKTYERRGVQQLVSDVALELLRQERSIMSAKTVYRHFATANEAQREFNRLSVQSRSKFDKETINRFGETDLSETPDPSDDDDLSKATAAVVTVSLSIEGDKTKLPRITTRDDLTTALARIASDALVDDCLLAGEVLWAPEARSDKLEKEDVFADYPDLYPL